MIEPTWQSKDGNVQLYLADCQAVLPLLSVGCVDAVITDPPYLSTDLHFDRVGMSLRWIDELLVSVMSNGYLALFAPILIQSAVAKVWSLRFTGCWLKEKGGMRTHSAKKPMNQWELYAVYAHPLHKISNLTWNHVFLPAKTYRKIQHNLGYKRGGKDQLDRSNTSTWTQEGYESINNGKRYQTDVIQGNTKGSMLIDERTEHPTQKPLNVMRTLVEWLTNPNDIVIDPFMGSGTTGVAAVMMGRKFIGIEISPEYFRISCKRIQEAQMQLRLDI